MNDQQQQQAIDEECRINGWRLNFAEPIASTITKDNYKSYTRRQTILFDVDANGQKSDEREAVSS